MHEVTAKLSPALVAGLRMEYPCLTTDESVSEMASQILWAWLRERQRVAATLASRVTLSAAEAAAFV